MSQGRFPQAEAWITLDALLAEQLVGVDVQPIKNRDFNENGELTMNPPSVRTQYVGTGFASTSDAQRLSYESVGRFLLLCAEEDHSADEAQQGYLSCALADRVCALVAGARIVLPNGDISEPITLTGMEPIPVDGIGMAYAVACEVPGLAQFEGVNAQPRAPQGGR